MTVIVAQKVWKAKEGKKFGSIVDPDGVRFMLPVGIENLFAEGQTYDVATSQKKWGDSVVTVIEGRPAGAPAPVSRVVPPQPAPAAPQGHNSARMATGDPKDIFIFVTGVVGRAMGSGSFGVTDVDLLTKAAIAAYKDNLARAL